MVKFKNCDYCSQSSQIRYRIQYDSSNQWQLVCPTCQTHLSQDNPYYRYGGTWKGSRKA